MDHEDSDHESLCGDESDGLRLSWGDNNMEVDSQDSMVENFAMLIIGLQNFRLAGYRFEKYVRESLKPDFCRIPLKTIAEACLSIFKRGKELVISELSSLNGVISLTCDLWVDVHESDYVCVSAHYIDSNWMSQKKIIAFCTFDYFLNDAQMCQSILSVITKYGIIDKIYSITFDDQIGNDVIDNKFEKRLQPPHGNQLFYVKCVCHTINSIVREGLELIKDHLRAIRYAIVFIRFPEARKEEFFTLCESQGLERKKIKLDWGCWNTTLFMLQSFVGYETVITDYYNTKRQAHEHRCLMSRCLHESDWKICFAFMEFLEVFYDATKVFASVYCPTSSIFLNHMCKISSVFAKYRDHHEFKKFFKVMEEMFKVYLDALPPIICLSASMDPTIKLAGVEVLINEISENLKSPAFKDINNIKNLLCSMYNTYESRFGSDRGAVPSTSNDYAWSLITKKHASSLQTELDMYLQFDFTKFLTREEFEKLDVLDWWRRHQIDFPILSVMARDVLTYPVSTIAGDSVFLSDNRTVSEKLSMCPPWLLDCMFCVKDWEDAKERECWRDEMAEEYFEDSDAEEYFEDSDAKRKRNET